MKWNELPYNEEPDPQNNYATPELNIINNENYIDDIDQEQPADQAWENKMPNGDPVSLMLWGVDE